MKTLDERASELAKSGFFGDIRMPMDVTARLEKARAEKKETVDGVDLDKIRAQKDGDKEEGDDKKPEDEKDEKPEESADDAEKSFRRIDGSSLQKARLMKAHRQPDALLIKVGAWVSSELHKSSDVATLRKAIANALPEFKKSAGKTLVAGMKEPGTVVESDARVIKLNTEVAKLQAAMAEADPFEQSVLFGKLQEVYESLAEAIMNSMGLGSPSEDLIAPDPKCEKPAAMVAKSQAEPIAIPENAGAEVVVSL